MNICMHTFAHVHGDQVKLLSVFFYNSLSYSLETGYLTEPGLCVFSSIRLAANNPSGPPTYVFQPPVLVLWECVWSGLCMGTGES